ncbi:MAG: hypothetical protein LIP01_06435 [Tannerellaceae bacterium]|nr:hypothetical protein [Tannerellaceae bacterium]
MKSKKVGYLTLIIIFAAVSIIAFVIPTPKTNALWITYIFTIIAFVIQIVIWQRIFKKSDPLKSRFLGVPLIYVGIVYLIVQIVVFAIFTAIPNLPVWNAIVICVLVMTVALLCLISAEVGREVIKNVDTKVQEKVYTLNAMQTEVELLADAETDAEIKTSLQQLAEDIRFSDPMSNQNLEDIELTISNKIIELKSSTDKNTIIKDIEMLVVERNKKCKILK